MRKRFFVVGGLALVVLALVATHSAAGSHEPHAASMGVVVAVCLAIGETAVGSLLAAALLGARASAWRGALAPLTGTWSDGVRTGEPPMRARDGPMLQTFLL